MMQSLCITRIVLEQLSCPRFVKQIVNQILIWSLEEEERTIHCNKVMKRQMLLPERLKNKHISFGTALHNKDQALQIRKLAKISTSQQARVTFFGWCMKVAVCLLLPV